MLLEILGYSKELGDCLEGFKVLFDHFGDQELILVSLAAWGRMKDIWNPYWFSCWFDRQGMRYGMTPR